MPLLKLLLFLTLSALSAHRPITASPIVHIPLESRPRQPPHIPQNPLLPSTLFTDQSDYLSLGDHVGTVLALGDFTNDRYQDLLVATDARTLRDVHILTWHHHSFSFRRPPSSPNRSFAPTFSLDTIPALPSRALIASAATFDANSDGLLDVILVVRLSDNHHLAVVLLGDGTGALRFDQLLSDIHPGLLILDANDDMLHDIFVTTPQGNRFFFINGPPGVFTRKLWNPWGNRLECIPTFPFNSNAYVDLDGDCQPDLIVTSSCGMEVWLNAEARHTRTSAWVNVQTFPKDRHDFSNMTYATHLHRTHILPRSVWAANSGDGRATFADFNGDGAIDVAVPNAHARNLRISFLSRRPRLGRRLCAADPRWRFHTHVALHDVSVPETNLGPTRVQGGVHVGDFNFDGLADILLLDGESGTLSLFVARSPMQRPAWFVGASSVIDRILFPITGGSPRVNVSGPQLVRYALYADTPILHHLEDPLAATFFDVDESGRQDILVPQQHGTRLIWNNYQKMEDAVFFKATGVNAAKRVTRVGAISEGEAVAHRVGENRMNALTVMKDGAMGAGVAGGPIHGRHVLSPPPGLTFKISYGGRTGRETQVCTQCPQTGVLSLQSCSCMFGITRIANYIEEMAMGGVGGVRTSNGLMPNALAVVWPERDGMGSGASLRWRVSYLSKGRDGQVQRIIVALSVTLVVLFFAILFIHGLENEAQAGKLDIAYS